MLQNMKGAIFDLDGVIVDTAKYHYLAWASLADELGFTFTEEDNERLKGVSRMNRSIFFWKLVAYNLKKRRSLRWRRRRIAYM